MEWSTMIKIPKFKGKDFFIGEDRYDHETYDEYIAQVQSIQGYTEHRLQDSYGGLPIYGFSIGDTSKPMIIIDGAIHNAHEWRSSYWIMHLMEIIANPALSPEYGQLLTKLITRYQFYFVPVVSPDGFKTRGNSFNGNDVDISQNFDYKWEQTPVAYKGSAPFSEPESQNIRDLILGNKPLAYINNHGWGWDSYHDFMIRRNVNSKYNLLSDKMHKSALISSVNPLDTDSRFNPLLDVSTAYSWAGLQEGAMGKVISNVLEVGGLRSAVEQSAIGVTGLLTILVHIDNYVTNGNIELF